MSGALGSLFQRAVRSRDGQRRHELGAEPEGALPQQQGFHQAAGRHPVRVGEPRAIDEADVVCRQTEAFELAA